MSSDRNEKPRRASATESIDFAAPLVPASSTPCPSSAGACGVKRVESAPFGGFHQQDYGQDEQADRDQTNPATRRRRARPRRAHRPRRRDTPDPRSSINGRHRCTTHRRRENWSTQQPAASRRPASRHRVRTTLQDRAPQPLDPEQFEPCVDGLHQFGPRADGSRT